ncbi:phage portal protein [Bacillus cytotoxicus]|uniref:phage portal protein n=1 Tax=unclassified Bacillus cereus group TaxID=2750818 RepID=UPI001F595004|nr:MULTISPECIES: phage portal protein [unclassified Bacillus cereus group]EMA6344873.1 phage portal protein [Bacillus cytotoxicus]
MFERLKQWFRTLFKRKGGVIVTEQYTAELKKDKWKQLSEILKEHDSILKQVEHKQKIYDGEFEIKTRQPKREDDPNHRIVVNYSKLICNMPSSYMLGKPVSIDIPDTITDKGVSKAILEEFRERLEQVTEDNEDHAVDFLNTKRGLIAGGATVLFYFDEMGQIRYKSYPLNECFPIFNHRGDMLAAIHRYTDTVNDEKVEYIEIYDSAEVTYLVRKDDSFALDGRYRENPKPHYIPIVPAAYFQNGEFAQPKGGKIYYGPSNLSDDIITQLEELSRLVSDNSNRLDVFCDPYLAFIGAMPDKDKMLDMRKSRGIGIKGKPGDKVDVKYLIADMPNDPVEWQAKQIIDSLFETSQLPKIYSEKAISDLSGVAIDQLYAPLDLQVNEKEIYLSRYIRRKLMIITMMLNAQKLLASKVENPAEVLKEMMLPGNEWPKDLYSYRWIWWEVHRNKPQNVKELIEILTKQDGELSKFTRLQHNPFVENIQEEQKRLKQEEAEKKEVDLNDIDGHLAKRDKRMQQSEKTDDEL